MDLIIAFDNIRAINDQVDNILKIIAYLQPNKIKKS